MASHAQRDTDCFRGYARCVQLGLSKHPQALKHVTHASTIHSARHRARRVNAMPVTPRKMGPVQHVLKANTNLQGLRLVRTVLNMPTHPKPAFLHNIASAMLDTKQPCLLLMESKIGYSTPVRRAKSTNTSQQLATQIACRARQIVSVYQQQLSVRVTLVTLKAVAIPSRVKTVCLEHTKLRQGPLPAIRAPMTHTILCTPQHLHPIVNATLATLGLMAVPVPHARKILSKAASGTRRVHLAPTRAPLPDRQTAHRWMKRVSAHQEVPDWSAGRVNYVPPIHTKTRQAVQRVLPARTFRRHWKDQVRFQTVIVIQNTLVRFLEALQRVSWSADPASVPANMT